MTNALNMLVTFTILVIFSGAASSHDSLPNYIELNEIENNSYHVKRNIPLIGTNSLKPSIFMLKDCVELKSLNTLKNNETKGKSLYRCNTAILGQSIVVTYPSINVDIPKNRIFVSPLSFNLGIEWGQIGFTSVSLPLMFIWKKVPVNLNI
jgi:hypothetical protein